MAMHNPNNTRIKRRYFAYLKEAESYSEATIDVVAKALSRFETDTKYRDFGKYHPEQAIAFKRHLATQLNSRSGEKLSKSTECSTLNHLKWFFHWLAGQPGYKSRLQYSDAAYFNPSKKDARVATARRDKKAPTLEQVRQVIALMPAESEIQRRDRALVAFTILTGARDGAIASLKLKHIDLETGSVHQDARDVKTKFSKSFTTFFLPIGDEIRSIFYEWVTYLREKKLWGNDDPVFPATHMALGASRQFEALGLARRRWSTAAPIRRIFREAFTRAQLPYFNPHSLRDTLVSFGSALCQTPEQGKALSQNFGHDDVSTTFRNYGEVSIQRQGEIMRQLANPRTNSQPNADEIAEAVARRLRRNA